MVGCRPVDGTSAVADWYWEDVSVVPVARRRHDSRRHYSRQRNRSADATVRRSVACPLQQSLQQSPSLQTLQTTLRPMTKTSQTLFHIAIAFVLGGCLTIGAVYVLPSTVFERFLHHHHDDCDDDCDHDHLAFQGPSLEIALNPMAARNIGLDASSIMTVEVVDFYRSLTFPAVVVERPGFSTITVPSPVSGVVSRIYHETGVAVEPGEPLFDILLNQQELVRAQTEFLTLLRRRDINTAERQRLANVHPDAIPGQHRTLEYERFQIDSEIEVQRSVLLLQGLSESDITESLKQNGTIVRSITVYAPPFVREDNVASKAHADDGEEHFFTIDELYVMVGRNVDVGDSLCRLFDYCKLAIKGKVFAAHERFLAHALASRSRVTAAFEVGASPGNRGERRGEREIIEGLFLRSIDNRIDPTRGTLFCYVDLQNRFTVHEGSGETNPRRYVQWHFKPGQRGELSIEYDPLLNCIVLPVDAVARDLQEFSVFEWVGEDEEGRTIWRKTPVHVLYQTRDVVVIANDGSLHPGDKVATRGASFILAALDAMNQRSIGGHELEACDHDH